MLYLKGINQSVNGLQLLRYYLMEKVAYSVTGIAQFWYPCAVFASMAAILIGVSVFFTLKISPIAAGSGIPVRYFRFSPFFKACFILF